MAKRKKLNKRVVVLLSVMGGILAVGVLAAVIARLPKDPTALAAKAELEMQAGNYREAVKYYGDAAGEAEKAGHELASKYYYDLARTSVDWAFKDPELTRSEMIEQYGRGRGALEVALRLDPKYTEAQQYLCELLWSEANQAGRWRPYIEQADKLLKLVPDDHVTYFRRGRAKMELADTMGGEWIDSVLEDLREAIKLKGDVVDYWRAMIGFLLRSDKRDEAEAIFAEAIATIPDSADMRIAHARYLRAIGKPEAAHAEIDEAIRAEPGSAAGYIELSQFHYSADNVAEAFEAIQEAKKVDSTDEKVYVLEAQLHIFQKQPDEASSVLREGLSAVERKTEELTGSEDEQAKWQLRALGVARAELSYLLANVLLDMIESNGVDTETLMTEVRACLQQVEQTSLDGPQRNKIVGRIALMEGRLTEAVKLLRQAHDAFLKTGVVDPKAATMLLRLYELQGNPGEGDRIVDQILAVPAQRKHPPALLLKARREIEYRRYNSALNWIKEALRIDPDNSEALQLKAVLEASTAAPEGLVEGKLGRQAMAVLLDRAQRLWAEEQRDEAIGLLAELHEKAPENVSVVMQLARMYVSGGRREEAAKLLAAAKARLGENEDIDFEIARLGETDPEKRFEMLLERVDKKFADDPLSAALTKANACAIVGNAQRELTYLQEAERVDPDSPALIQQMFTYATRQKDWPLAEQYADKAAEADVDGLEGAGVRIRLAQAKGEYESAIGALQDLLARRPELKTAWVAIGQCYLATEQFVRARESYAEAERRDPGFAAAIVGLARVAEGQNKWQEHERWIRRAYQLPLGRRHPYVSESYLNYEEKNATDETIAAKIIPKRERIAKRQPNDLINRYHLAVLYERMERFGQAEKTYRYIYENALDKIEAAKLLAKYYVRAQRSSLVDKIFSELLTKAQTPADKAKIWVAWSTCLQFYSLEQALAALGKAIENDPSLPDAHLAKAQYLAKQQRWAEAVGAMETYLQLNPPDPENARKDLILYLIESGKTDEAAKRIDAILAADSTDSHGLTLKGIIAWKQRQLSKAESLFDRAIEMNPDSPLPLRYRTKLHIERGELARAKEDLQKALQLSDTVTLSMDLAAVCRALGDLAQAEQVYRDILRGKPRHEQATEQLVSLYLQQGKWDQMESQLRSARRIFPNNVMLVLYEVQMWRARNDLARQMSAYAKALEMAPRSRLVVTGYMTALLEAGKYDDVIRIAGRYEDEPEWAAVIKAHRAAALAKKGKSAEAEQLFITAVQTASPNQLAAILAQAELAYGLSLAPQKINRWADRKGDWSIYLYLGAMYKRAELQKRRPDYSAAITAYQKALELTDEPQAVVSINSELGITYTQMRQWKNSEKAYLAVLETRPDEMTALNNLAYIYVDELDEPQKAEPFAKRALDLRPGDQNVVDTYGWTLAKLGQYEEARRQLLRSLQMGQPIPDNRYHLGWVYEQTRQYGEALHQYQLALEFAAGRPEEDTLKKNITEAIGRVRADIGRE